MCVLCGVLLNDHWAEQEGGRSGRVFRGSLINRVLDHYGLRLDDWSGRIWTLRDRKGNSVVVADLGALWTEAERLAGRKLDPLDPAFGAALGPARAPGDGRDRRDRERARRGRDRPPPPAPGR